jgi:hypothetical protein
VDEHEPPSPIQVFGQVPVGNVANHDPDGVFVIVSELDDLSLSVLLWSVGQRLQLSQQLQGNLIDLRQRGTGCCRQSTRSVSREPTCVRRVCGRTSARWSDRTTLGFRTSCTHCQHDVSILRSPAPRRRNCATHLFKNSDCECDAGRLGSGDDEGSPLARVLLLRVFELSSDVFPILAGGLERYARLWNTRVDECQHQDST